MAWLDWLNRADDPPPKGPWTHRQAVVNGVRLYLSEAGPVGGPLVVLLHGFPDFWYGWRHQIPALAAAGYRVVAPDLRGYNRSEKPPGVGSYRLSTLVADVAALIEQSGYRTAHLVGHDWGGVIAWALAMRRPELLENLVILNAPHPAAYRRELWRNPAQRHQSWYVAVFQLPWLPELLFRLRGHDIGGLIERTAMRPEVIGPTERRLYRQAFRRPGAMTASLNYYRALLRYGSGPTRRIDPPTLLIWGEQDVALVPELTQGLDRLVPNLHVERLPGASHWVMADAPEQVNALLIEFLGRS